MSLLDFNQEIENQFVIDEPLDDETSLVSENDKPNRHPLVSADSDLEETSDFDSDDDDDSINPLSAACLQNVSSCQLKISLHLSNEEMKVDKDDDGNTALHHAITLFSDDERLFMMIKACPKASFVTDNMGWLPLHYAITQFRSTAVIRALLAANPRAVIKYNHYGHTPLELLFQQWNHQLTKLNETSSVITSDLFIDQYLKYDNFKRGITVKWIYDVTIMLLEDTLRYSYNDFSHEGSFNSLRAALIVEKCPWSFFHMLLRIDSGNASLQDINGNTLLHTIASTRPTSDGELYECCNCETVFLSHWYQHKSERHTKFCEECFNNDVTEDYKKDFYIMHPVFKIPAVIADLKKLHPDLASVPNNDGQLPLSLAIKEDKTFLEQKSETIFEASPTAIQTRDMKTNMYPFMLAAEQETDIEQKYTFDYSENVRHHFGLCYYLLMECPTLVDIGIPNKGSKRKNTMT